MEYLRLSGCDWRCSAVGYKTRLFLFAVFFYLLVTWPCAPQRSCHSPHPPSLDIIISFFLRDYQIFFSCTCMPIAPAGFYWWSQLVYPIQLPRGAGVVLQSCHRVTPILSLPSPRWNISIYVWGSFHSVFPRVWVNEQTSGKHKGKLWLFSDDWNIGSCSDPWTRVIG